MSSWLSRLSECTQSSQHLASSLDTQRRAYLVLDTRRAPEACAAWIGQSGWYDFMALFAGTPLSPLLEASPWLVELKIGSDAWHSLSTLCRQERLGWAFQPREDTPLNDLADHLRTYFVLGDPHGGQSLVNLQDPAAWTALLAAIGGTAYAQLVAPLGQVVTPTPQHTWLAWQPANHSENPAPLTLVQETNDALQKITGAWWLSQATDTPLPLLPPAWLTRLTRLTRAGITRTEHLQRLLRLICQPEAAFSTLVEQALHSTLLARQKVSALEKLI